jgi:hypothetical protein
VSKGFMLVRDACVDTIIYPDRLASAPLPFSLILWESQSKVYLCGS